MAGRERRRLCKFLSDWTVSDQFSSWLTPVKGDKHKAYCLLCKKVFAVSHGGLNDVKAHYKGKRHIWLQLEQQQQETVEDPSNLWEGHTNFRSKNNAQNIVFNEETDALEESFGLNPRSVPRFEDETIGYDLTQNPTPSDYWEFEDFEPHTTSSFVADTNVLDESTPKKKKMNSHHKMLPQQYCLRWKYHHNNLQVMFSQLLERESYCDVTIACEGKTLRAHKMVLSACSTYFDAIFSQHEEKNPIVILKDVKFSDIKALIEFMYKGEINVDNSHLTSLLKTAEDLHIKGLAEVSWRSDRNAPHPVEEDTSPIEQPFARVDTMGNGSDVEPPMKRRRGRPLMENDNFNPMVTSVTGAVGTENAFTVQEPIIQPEEELEETVLDDSEPEVLSDNDAGESQSFTQDPLNDTETPEPESTPSSESILQRIADQYRDVIKLNDYLTTGRRQQFWEEPFTRRVMEAIKGKELEMKVGAELLGVSYGTLYGRYRDAYGCLKHPYRSTLKAATTTRVRDFWSESGPADILAKVQRKEITLFRAAEMLNVTVTTLANYLSTLRQPGSGSGDETEKNTIQDEAMEADEDDGSVEEMMISTPIKSEKIAALENNADISIVKQEGVKNHDHHTESTQESTNNNLHHSDSESSGVDEVNGTDNEITDSPR